MENNDNEVKETRITEFLELKQIIGGETNLNILGKANKIDIKGGSHHLTISSPVDNLTIFGGYRELNIRSFVDTLNIFGGISKIIVYNYGNTKVNNFNITGGNHEITIYSYVNELNLKAGVCKIKCNFENSRINKIKSMGGIKDIFLNQNTDKAFKESKGGTFNIHKTGILPEPIYFEDKNAEIPITIFSGQKVKDSCAICLGDFVKGEKVYYLPCIHCFHVDCLREWNKKNNTCPNCKFEIKIKLAKN